MKNLEIKLYTIQELRKDEKLFNICLNDLNLGILSVIKHELRFKNPRVIIIGFLNEKPVSILIETTFLYKAKRNHSKEKFNPIAIFVKKENRKNGIGEKMIKTYSEVQNNPIMFVANSADSLFFFRVRDKLKINMLEAEEP